MIRMPRALSALLAGVISVLLSSGALAAENNLVIVGGEGADCIEDPGCVNRLHPDIPMAARARPGQTILFRARDARDVLGAAAAQTTVDPLVCCSKLKFCVVLISFNLANYVHTPLIVTGPFNFYLVFSKLT